MRSLSYLCILATFPLFVSACGGEDSSGSGGGEGYQIPGTAMIFPNAEVHDGPMPEPTSTGNEPIIEDYHYEMLGADRAVLTFEVSGGPLEMIYWEIDDVVYKILPDRFDAGGLANGDIVDMLCASNPEADFAGCDPRCLDACDCVTCDDSTVAESIIGNCAAACSSHLEHGAIPTSVYGSIGEFVDKWYFGYPEYEGALGILHESQYAQRCSGSLECRAPVDGDVSEPIEVQGFEFKMPHIPSGWSMDTGATRPQGQGTLSGANSGLTGAELSNTGPRLSCSPPR